MQKSKRNVNWLGNIKATVKCWSKDRDKICKRDSVVGTLYCRLHQEKALQTPTLWKKNGQVIEIVKKIFFLFCFGIKNEQYPELPAEMRCMIWHALVDMYRDVRKVSHRDNESIFSKSVEKVFGVKHGLSEVYSSDYTLNNIFWKTFYAGCPQGMVKRSRTSLQEFMEERYSLEKGLLHGDYYYTSSGKVSGVTVEGHFTRGVPDGKWTMKKGLETMVIHNPNGNGECFRYDKDKVLKERGFHSQRSRVGCWIFYDKLGEKRAGSYDTEGKKHGVWQSRNYTTRYDHGKKSGPRKIKKSGLKVERS